MMTKSYQYKLYISFILALLSSCQGNHRSITGFTCALETAIAPDTVAVGRGLIGAYAGLQDKWLIVAGGYSSTRIDSDTHKREYNNQIFVSSTRTPLQWHMVDTLALAQADGASVQSTNGLICIGGRSAKGVERSVFRLYYDATNKRIRQIDLPSLPYSIELPGAAMINEVLYVIGGKLNSKSSNRVYALDLNDYEKGWIEKRAFPGYPRIAPTVIAQKSPLRPAIFLLGGYSEPTYLARPTISYESTCYYPDQDYWLPISSPKREDNYPVFLGGSVAARTSDGNFICIGGVDGTLFYESLQREYQILREQRSEQKSILKMLLTDKRINDNLPVANFRYNSNLYHYNIRDNQWTVIGNNPLLSLNRPAIAFDETNIYLFNGLIKPELATSNVLKMNFR